MARPGVTYSEVAAAALELQARGKHPTIEQIRLILGTGSSTTIANHLREWKQSQDQTNLLASKENLPQELVSVLKGLWDRINNLADEKIQTLVNSHGEETAFLQNEALKYKNNNQRWQSLFNQWTKEKEQLLHEKEDLAQSLNSMQKEHEASNAKHEAACQQLAEKQQRINELHNLHKQAQENLEHYRESAREQRLLDQQQFEKEKQELQWQLKSTADQLLALREKHFLSMQEYQQLQTVYTKLENTHRDAQTKLATQAEKIANLQKQNDNFIKEIELLGHQHKEHKDKIEFKTKQLMELHAEHKVISQQLADAKTALNDANESNKLLSHEKWILTKENSQLEGQLRQLDKIKRASTS